MADIENSKLEDELVDLKLQNKEMAAELGFKKEKIDKLERSLSAIEEKLDKLIERSEERDNINEKRLVALETSQSNIRTFITIGFSLLSIIIGALGLVVAFLH
jgi:predicted  nucleic acid-binding Zn-ribbon protein